MTSYWKLIHDIQKQERTDKLPEDKEEMLRRIRGEWRKAIKMQDYDAANEIADVFKRLKERYVEY